jgi:hypothetical protein
MPETESIVINTGPLLALIAGYGDSGEALIQQKLVLKNESFYTEN